MVNGLIVGFGGAQGGKGGTLPASDPDPAPSSSSMTDWETAPAVTETPDIKLFGKWSTDDVQINDISLQVLHWGGSWGVPHSPPIGWGHQHPTSKTPETSPWCPDPTPQDPKPARNVPPMPKPTSPTCFGHQGDVSGGVWGLGG